MLLRALTIFLPLFIAAPALASPIYVWKDKSGATHFTNRAPPAGIEAQVWTGRKTNFSVFKVGPRRSLKGKLFKSSYAEIINEVSDSHGVSPHLVRAVIHAESAFDPRAISPKGARGLMQIMPATAQELGLANSFDPSQNISAGVKYLAFLLGRYDGNLSLALAAYNAGPGAVEEHNGIPPYSETRAYVQRVLDLKRRYERG
jgi:soluble lytic murein transglycosylase-like protein